MNNAHNGVSRTVCSEADGFMEAIIVLAIVASLVIFDILAIRYGADSRIYDNTRPNW